MTIDKTNLFLNEFERKEPKENVFKMSKDQNFVQAHIFVQQSARKVLRQKL